MDVTLLGLPSIPPTHVQTHRPATHVVSLLSHLSSILYYISLTGLWNAAANHEGYDRRRNDTNTFPHTCARGRSRLLRLPHSTPTPSLGRFYGNDLYIWRERGVEYGGGDGRKGRQSVISTGASHVSDAPLPTLPHAVGCEGCLGESKVEILGNPVPADHACMTDFASSCTHS